MMADEMKRLLALLALLALAGCGVNEAGGAGEGGISLKVTGARSFDPNAEHGRVEKYRVTVEGEGIEPKIVREFSGDLEEGVITGVPAGVGRTVSVEAVNPNRLTIRAGEADGVRVGGGITEVPVEMEAVPIFINVADGSTVYNTRLAFKIFSDPANPVTVREHAGETARALVDASTNLSEIFLDAATGVGKFAPVVMDSGKRAFAVSDVATGRTHRVSVLVVDGTAVEPAPLVSSTSGDERGSACSAPWCAP